MRAAISAALCLFFAASGAAVAGEGLLGRLFGGASPSDVPKSIWQREADASGTHLQSQLKCPVSAGPFRLTALIATDAFGFDVWCQYDTATRDRITLYLTQRQGESLQDDLEVAKSAIPMSMPGAMLMAPDGQESFTNDSAWLSALYDAGRARTGVWVTDFSGWTFKFRATYAPAQQQAAFDAMSELARSATNSAGARLGACANRTALERTGRPIADERQAIPLAVTATVMAYAPLRGPNAPPFIEPIWCPAEPLTVEGQPFLLWYNIAQQNGGPVDRLTAMRDGDPVTILTVFDSIQNTIPAAYDIAIESETTISIVGIYDGPPTIEEIARFGPRGYVGVFASIDKRTGRVTVFRSPIGLTPERSSP
jgi:hypothetical protein